MKKHIVSIFLAFFISAGCSSGWIQLSNGVDKPPANGKKAVFSESACGFNLLGFIPISINDRYARAWKRLNNLTQDAFIEKIIAEESWTYAYVGTVYCTEITVNVVRP